jgi:hypothetical protein
MTLGNELKMMRNKAVVAQCSGIIMEFVRGRGTKSHHVRLQDSLCPDEVSNWASPEIKSDTLPLESIRSVTGHWSSESISL